MSEKQEPIDRVFRWPFGLRFSAWRPDEPNLIPVKVGPLDGLFVAQCRWLIVWIWRA